MLLPPRLRPSPCLPPKERCIRAPEVAVDLQQMATGCCHMQHVGRQTLDLHAAAAAAATFLCRSNPLAINCLARNYFVVKMGAFTHKHTRIPAHTHTHTRSHTDLVYPMHNLGFCS